MTVKSCFISFHRVSPPSPFIFINLHLSAPVWLWANYVPFLIKSNWFISPVKKWRQKVLLSRYFNMHLNRIKGNVLCEDKYLSGVLNLFGYAVFQSQSRSLGPQNKSILDVLKVGWPCSLAIFGKVGMHLFWSQTTSRTFGVTHVKMEHFFMAHFLWYPLIFYHFSARFILFPEKEEMLLFQLSLGVRDVLHLWDPSTNSKARMEWNFLMEWETHWSTHCSQLSTANLQ